jgi:hypothetical protein
MPNLKDLKYKKRAENSALFCYFFFLYPINLATKYSPIYTAINTAISVSVYNQFISNQPYLLAGTALYKNLSGVPL